MLNFFKAKIHRATVTEAKLDYEGSITLDQRWMQEAKILPHEQVHVYNITNGNRLITYAIEGPPESGVCCLNGAAARLVAPGDRVIIVAYCLVSAEEAETFRPRVLLIDDNNKIKDSFFVSGGSPKPAGAPMAERRS